MKKRILIFMTVLLLSQHAVSGGKSGLFGNMRNIVVLGAAALMGRGDQALYNDVQRLHREMTTAESATLEDQRARLVEIQAVHQRYVDFVTQHGGDLQALEPTQVNTWLTEAQRLVAALEAPASREILIGLRPLRDAFDRAQTPEQRAAVITSIRLYLNQDEITVTEGENHQLSATTDSEDLSLKEIVKGFNQLFKVSRKAAKKRTRE